jgi:alpha-tubulin suppressor-like RCC1 family protein
VRKWCRTPGAVTDLQNLPNPALIKEIAAGGYATAALTGDGDCYIWGSSRHLAFLTAEPTPLDFDVQSVAIGEEHMIVLTKEGEVRVCGKNRNGQLGLGDGITEVKEWTTVDLKGILGKGGKVVAVKAGGNCSLLIVMVEEEREN